MKEDLEYLIGQLSSFYKQHLPEHSGYEKLLETYIESFRLLYLQSDLIRQNSVPQTQTSIEIIPYAQLNMSSAIYDVKTAAELLSLSQAEQLDKLESSGYVATLNFNDLKYTPDVYSLELKKEFDSDVSLVLFDDYILESNKIYLLPKAILSNQASPIMHAYNIAANHYLLEKNYGTFHDLEFNHLVLRSDAQRIVNAFEKLFSGNFSIKSIKQAIRETTGWETFDIQDFSSRNLSAQKKDFYAKRIFSPLTFIVSLPEEVLTDNVNKALLFYLLDSIKEVQTNYAVSHEFLRTDFLDRNELGNQVSVIFSFIKNMTGITETLQDTHSVTVHSSNQYVDELSSDSFGFFYDALDNQLSYDGSACYDDNVFVVHSHSAVPFDSNLTRSGDTVLVRTF